MLLGSVPWDLEVEKRIAMRGAKRGRDSPEWGVSAADGASRREICAQVAVMAAWQARWERESTGRELYTFIPDVHTGSSMAMGPHSWPAGYILTGHGDIASYQMRIRSRLDDGCGCGTGRETPEHIVRDCPWYRRERAELGRALGIDIASSELSELLSREGGQKHFVRFANRVFETRDANLERQQEGGQG